MVGSLWLSVFRLKQDVDALRPAGIYGAAFVSYEEGSPLTYSELLVARALPRSEGRGRKVSITDIWVDSPASVAGGRELWAIPKGLCDFELDTAHRGPLSSTEWSASLERRPIASASFRDVSRVAPAPAVQGRDLAAGAARGRRREGRDPAGVIQGPPGPGPLGLRRRRPARVHARGEAAGLVPAGLVPDVVRLTHR